MESHKKNIALQNCNQIGIDDLIKLIDNGDITIDEFIAAGLDQQTVGNLQRRKSEMDNLRLLDIQRIDQERREEEQRKIIQEDKERLIQQILKKQIGADKIKRAIDSNIISFDELKESGLQSNLLNSLKHFCDVDRVTRKTTIDQLPAMEEERTDVYFVGVPGSGKSTMLAGLLKIANQQGRLLPDTYNNAGSLYQNNLITDLNKGVLPNATIAGSYNYVALSLRDDKGKKHPFNIVEIPGENYVNILNNADVKDILKYVSNSNKKILVFVIDALAHDNNYSDSTTQLDQNLAYTNILQMFRANGILEKTDSIYLVANKFDTIIENHYPHDSRKKGDLAVEFLEMNFKNLIENCKMARKGSRNKFKIKIFPYSIGYVAYNNIMESFNEDFSNSFIKLIIADSFVVRGGVSKVLQTN